MSEKPILFNTDMVRAILDGRKTQARRVMKPQPLIFTGRRYVFADETCPKKWEDCEDFISTYQYQPGDILWVRETWAEVTSLSDPFRSGGNALAAGIDSWFYYKADNKKLPYGFKWHPSIHMPRKAARIFLKVTGVRAERVQDITAEDVLREGISITEYLQMEYTRLRKMFADHWNSELPKYYHDWMSWQGNPWVWVIEFERVDKA